MRSVEETSTATSIRAVLEGGPSSLPEAQRVQTVGAFIEKIKIPHYGGYEHFERSGGHGGPGEPGEHGPPAHVIFRWTMRTKVAE